VLCIGHGCTRHGHEFSETIRCGQQGTVVRIHGFGFVCEKSEEPKRNVDVIGGNDGGVRVSAHVVVHVDGIVDGGIGDVCFSVQAVVHVDGVVAGADPEGGLGGPELFNIEYLHENKYIYVQYIYVVCYIIVINSYSYIRTIYHSLYLRF
jgi:hypothetical protein